MSEFPVSSPQPAGGAADQSLAEAIGRKASRRLIMQALLDRHIERGAARSTASTLRPGMRVEDLPASSRRDFEKDADAVLAAIALGLRAPVEREDALDIPKPVMSRDDRAEKRAMGFSGEICPVCNGAEVMREGTGLVCRNCGATGSLHLREVAGGRLQAEKTSFHDGALDIPKSPTPRDDRAEKRAMGFSGEVCSVCSSTEMMREEGRLVCRNCGTTRLSAS